MRSRRSPTRRTSRRSRSASLTIDRRTGSPSHGTKAGKEHRKRVPRSRHAVWKAPRNRPDRVDLLIESSEGRVPELVPIRYARMLQSPFAFYRGAAAIMAADLAGTPTTGHHVQSCGDCHLVNFGGFATAERQLIFDINDFDETSPAPWEWDVKRLAASFVVAGRNNQLAANDSRTAAVAAVRSYREHVLEYAQMPVLETWYANVELHSMIENFADPDMRRRYRRVLRKEKARSSLNEFPRLAQRVGDRQVIKDDPPLIYHLDRSFDPQLEKIIQELLGRYRASLPHYRRVLFDRFRFADLAIKVVGVGSVGTMCAIALFVAGENDPLFLQIKEARRSVLEPYAGKSAFPNRGQRVVVGQRLMQAATDTFLGWTQGRRGRHYYVRQLRDVKVKPEVEAMAASHLRNYALLCGWALARAHARSADAALLAGYLGKGDAVDEAIGDFAVAYADQNESDYAALQAAVRKGRLPVRDDV